MADQPISKKAISEEVVWTSEFWQNHRRELAAIQQKFTGREAEYLERVKPVLMQNVEAARQVLLRETGFDLKTNTQVSPLPDPADFDRRRAWWENVKRYGQDYIQIGKTVARTMEIAKRHGRNPMLEGYAAFFWAFENVPAAGTVFLMLDTYGDEKEHTALLTAGWADAHISLQGQHAGRLRTALLPEYDARLQFQPQLRQELRQQLPAAVLEAAQEWPSGQELLGGERAVPASGKKTAGRRRRTLLSRITRLIERQGTSKPLMSAQLIDDHAKQWQGAATRQAAQDPARTLGKPSTAPVQFHALWHDLVQSARLGPNEAQIAAYVTAHPDCLAVRPCGRLRLRRGTQIEIAHVLERPSVNVRQETVRMLRKLEKVRVKS